MNSPQPPIEAFTNDFETFKRLNEPLENFAKLHQAPDTSQLLDLIQSPLFDNRKWAFRGHGDASQLPQASIERVASKPEIAEEYVEREFKRRAHHYL